MLATQKRLTQIAEQIGEVGRIVAFRNMLVHGYFKLVDDIVWTIISDDLAKLTTHAAAILNEMNRQ